MKTSGRLQDVFMEDFRKELGEIQHPLAKRLFVLAKAQHLIHLRIGEYTALIAAADMTGNYEVGLLLESACGPACDGRTGTARHRAHAEKQGGGENGGEGRIVALLANKLSEQSIPVLLTQ